VSSALQEFKKKHLNAKGIMYNLPPLPVTPFSREGFAVLKKDGKLGRSDTQVIAPY
jgi:hypothetical protein